MTGLLAWPRAVPGWCRQCATVAAETTSSSSPASTHTTWASTRTPGTVTGRVAAAVATMEVPMTEANQLGPMFATASRRSSAVPNRPGAGSGASPCWS